MFTVISGDDQWENLTYHEMRLREAMYRGLRISYTIIYPNGDKINCEIIEHDKTL
jgi:hypothetical protein